MHQIDCSTSFLHIYDVEYESWAQTPLGFRVSPHTLEAMNLILEKDGILAFIGTRSEFGLYQTKLDKRPETGSMSCWISCPDHTILSMLGLCRNMVEPGKPEVAFYGSPLTLMLSVMMKYRDQRDVLDQFHRLSKGGLPIYVTVNDYSHFGDTGTPIFPVEYQRALSYYRELNTPFGPQQTDRAYVGLSTLRIC